MKDERKTKKELVKELQQFRRKVTKLEKSEAKLKRAEDEISRQAAVLDAINRVFQETLTCETEEELGEACLAAAEELTGSKFGFLGEINPAGLLDDIAISNPGWDACEIAVTDARKHLRDMPIRGIDRGTIREGKSRIVNEDEMATHPDRVGTPEGHPRITAFLGVPLKHEGKVVGLIGLGNKKGGYDIADQTAVENLAVAIVEALRSKRAEERAKHLNRVLRAVRNVNQLITKEKDRGRMIKGACENLIETRGYRSAWIALLDESGKMETTAEAGVSSDDFQLLTGRLKSGEPVFCVRKTMEQPGVFVIMDRPSTCGDCPLAGKFHGMAGMTVRLEYEGKSYGLMSVSIPAYVVEDEEEQSLFSEVADDIAFALYTIETEEERKRAEDEISRQAAVLDAINRVFKDALTCETEEELGKTCLAAAERLTGSEFGYIGEVNPAGLMDGIAISDPGWEACKMAVSDARKYIKDMQIRGIDRSTIREEKSRIVNEDEMATHPDRVGTPEGHPRITAFLGVPLKHEGRTIGMIGLGNKKGGYDMADQEAVENLAVAVVEVLRSKRAEKERESLLHDVEGGYRELECVHGVAESIRERETLDEVFMDVAALIPTGWRYPEIARGKVRFEGGDYVSEPFKETKWKQTSDIVVRGEKRGVVEVYYLEERPLLEEGPFLEEERDLIDGIARTLAEVIERKRAEEGLRVSGEKMRSVVESSPIGISIYDRSGQCVAANDSLAKIVGATKDQVLQQNYNSIESWKRSGLLDIAKSALKENSSKRHEMVTESAFGKTVQLDCYLIPFSSGSLLFMASDISERKRAEKELVSAKSRLEYLLNVCPAIIYTCEASEDFPLRFISDNVVSVYGYTAEEYMAGGQEFHDSLVHPEDMAKMEADFRDAAAKGHGASEYRHLHKDGTYRWVHDEIKLVRDARGNPYEYVGYSIDITEHRQLEEQLRQSAKMDAIGQLAGGIAHDFNNQLTAIIGFGEFAMQSLDADHPAREHIEQVQLAGKKAASLTRQILAFGRRQVLQPRILSLNTVLGGCEKMLRRIVSENIELVFHQGKGLRPVKIDPWQMEQVIMNLAINARDSMPWGGRLTIETANVDLDEEYASSHPGVQPGSYVMAAVSDNGCGMDEETLSHIFEPFFTTKKEGEGTGLGLATVHGIVRQSGGHVYAYSEPGKGTTIKVYIPKTDEIAESEKEEKEPAVSLKGSETILLVEDEEQVRDFAKRVLEKNGYRVLAAADGEEALRVLRSHRGAIQLLMTDVVMPKMGGPELAARAADMRPDIKVIYLSGYAESAITRNGVLEPGTVFLQKPVTVKALSRKVREVLDAARRPS